MKNSKAVKGLLVVAGLIGLYIGGSLLFFPAELQAQSNILLGDNASLLSETRAPGSAILSASIIMLTGIFRTSWRYTAVLLVALFFLSYGIGRLLSIVLDGMPAPALFYAMIAELVLGAIALVMLLKMKRVNPQ